MPKSNNTFKLPGWMLNCYYFLRASFWFWPSLWFVFAILAAYLVIRFDKSYLAVTVAQWIPGGPMSVEGARSILSTIAASTITVASLVFSLTFVALTLMSQQFGPRILLILMKDRITQFVIGIFVATFIYALLMLAAIEGGETGSFVSQFTVYAACALALLAFGSVIYFIHHIARTIQADSVAAQLGRDLNAAIESTLLAEHPEDGDETHGLAMLDPPDRNNATPICLEASGYVQLIDFEDALALMEEKNGRLRYVCRPGHFVVEDEPVAYLQMADNAEPDEGFVARTAATIHLGPIRTQAQQAEYEVNALVEVALRALSPGINDPFTAIGCLNHLTDALMRLATEEMRAFAMFDSTAQARVFKHPQTFAHYLNSAFHPIRQSSRGNTQMLIHLSEAMETLARAAKFDDRKAALLEHAEILLEDCRTSIDNKTDRERVCGKVKEVCKLLG